jgi:hypothetical protein
VLTEHNQINNNIAKGKASNLKFKKSLAPHYVHKFRGSFFQSTFKMAEESLFHTGISFDITQFNVVLAVVTFIMLLLAVHTLSMGRKHNKGKEKVTVEAVPVAKESIGDLGRCSSVGRSVSDDGAKRCG